ncbi:MAG: 3-deoxy-8-phosphooctulonate synthase [Deltaproteobacteria bacterium]|nr:3-deoxy-8-phosphooctulonate synthase [Deltaproteobacteria bacterium]
MKQINLTKDIVFGGDKPLLMAGNCILEDRETAFKTCEFLKKLAAELDAQYVFKASYKKDNRSSVEYFTGLPLDQALRIFEEIKQEFDVPVVTDVHYPSELNEGVAEVIDILQVPAYLAMQTELVMAIARTGKTVNLKKAQFLHPEDMKKVCAKVESANNTNILLTERGTCFGYRDMVVDIRALQIMKSFGYPVLYDAGHSIRKYGVPSSDPKGGAKEYLDSLMPACAAVDLAGLFIEVHPEPKRALCDAASQLDFDEARTHLTRYFQIARFVKDLAK